MYPPISSYFKHIQLTQSQYFADEIPEDERPWQLPAWSKKSHQWVEKR
jgi:hypothetical protein